MVGLVPTLDVSMPELICVEGLQESIYEHGPKTHDNQDHSMDILERKPP